MKTIHIRRDSTIKVYPWSQKNDGYETEFTANTIEEKLELLASVVDELLERVKWLEQWQNGKEHWLEKESFEYKKHLDFHEGEGE